MGTYQMYGRGERTFGGMMRRPPNVPVSCWLYYITVADIRQSLDNVQKLGGQVIHGPQEVPGGDLVAQCMDPQGAMFALHEHAGS
ncbi:MAG: hypothetical protein R3E12_07270 [Candidatus Eisenbacteria bacterium]